MPDYIGIMELFGADVARNYMRQWCDDHEDEKAYWRRKQSEDPQYQKT